MIKKKILMPDDFETKLKKLKDKFKKEKINSSDGVKVDFKDGWLHIRKSNTEPIIRLIAEAKTKVEAEKLISQGIGLLS
jgi:phosphomannomutase